MSSPFVERCIQLSESEAFVGLIIDNQFMKRDYGRPLVEDVLANVDLSLVVDTSQTFIPHHGTPTVLLFARNRRPNSTHIRAVMGKRGEDGIPVEPARGGVWSSILAGWSVSGFDDEYITVADAPRDRFARHPWTLAGGGIPALKERLDKIGTPLASVVEDIGIASWPGFDDAFIMDRSNAQGLGIPDAYIKPLVLGQDIRDWNASPSTYAIAAYDRDHKEAGSEALGAGIRHFWRLRTTILSNKNFGGESRGDAGDNPWTWYRWVGSRYETPLTIAFSFIATQNHFALVRGGVAFNRSAPVVKLPKGSCEDDHLPLLSILNSSVACFWMKQVFQPKGATSANRNHPDPERFAHEFAVNGIGRFPIPNFDHVRSQLLELGRRLDLLSRERARVLSADRCTCVLSSVRDLQSSLTERWLEHDRIRQELVFAQEELDWLVYHVYGLTSEPFTAPGGPGRLPRGQRAFERLLGHRCFIRERGALLSPEVGECETGDQSLPSEYESITARRKEEIRRNESVALIESYMHKRLWRDTEANLKETEFRARHDKDQLSAWFLDRIVTIASAHSSAFTVSSLCSGLMADASVQVVAEVLAGTSSYSLESIVSSFLNSQSVPNHPYHVFTDSGLAKRTVWEDVWNLQAQQDAGTVVDEITAPPEYSQGSRGKSIDYRRTSYWTLRGKLDVQRERFIAFTETTGRVHSETLFGWAGWSSLRRIKAILEIDEALEDAAVSLGDRIGLLDSAWRLLPDVAREDAAAATRLKAELQALVGPEGPSRDLIEDWKKRVPPLNARAARANEATAAHAEVEDFESQERAEP